MGDAPWYEWTLPVIVALVYAAWAGKRLVTGRW
mgnify:CR=1 FL=1